MSRQTKLPGVRRRPFYARELWSSLGGVGSVLASIGATVQAWPAKDPVLIACAILAAVCGLWSFLTALGLAHYKDSELAKKEDPADLTACLLVLHHVLTKTAPGQSGPTNILRITIYRAIQVDQLEQCVGYVGGTGGPAGRKFSSKSGVIGLAFRKKGPVVATRKTSDPQQFVREMIDQWGYSEEEAKELSQDRVSWMAVPITTASAQDAAGEVEGVVFFDSCEPNYFTSQVQESAIAGCMGLSKYVAELK